MRYILLFALIVVFIIIIVRKTVYLMSFIQQGISLPPGVYGNKLIQSKLNIGRLTFQIDIDSVLEARNNGYFNNMLIWTMVVMVISNSSKLQNVNVERIQFLNLLP